MNTPENQEKHKQINLESTKNRSISMKSIAISEFTRDESTHNSSSIFSSSTSSSSQSSNLRQKYKNKQKVNINSYKKTFNNFFPIHSIYDNSLILSKINIEPYSCQLCKNICEEPVIDDCGCGKKFCRKCLEYYLIKNKFKCFFTKKIVKNIQKYDDLTECIYSIKIKCKNYINNCDWEGKISEYKTHLFINCPKQYILCPNENCYTKIIREKMNEHLLICQYKKYICDKCNMQIQLIDKENHINICPKEEIKCSQCNRIFLREELEKHNEKCNYFFMKCPFWEIGCNDMKSKKEAEEMLKEEKTKHLLMLLQIKKMVDEKKKIHQKNIFEKKETNFELISKNNIKGKEESFLSQNSSYFDIIKEDKNEEINNNYINRKKNDSFKIIAYNLSKNKFLFKKRKRSISNKNIKNINNLSQKDSATIINKNHNYSDNKYEVNSHDSMTKDKKRKQNLNNTVYFDRHKNYDYMDKNNQ